MKNLSIEQQKEFEKMIAEINRLHQENDDFAGWERIPQPSICVPGFIGYKPVRTPS